MRKQENGKQKYHRAVAALTAALALICVNHSDAATVHVESLYREVVGLAYTNASAGDTLVLPVGRMDWSNGLTIDKAITIRGAGALTADDFVYSIGGRTNQSFTNWAIAKVGLSASKTVIVDAVADRGMVLTVNAQVSPYVRISGIQFAATNSVVGNNANGVVRMAGSNVGGKRVRVDHCYFNDLMGAQLFNYDSIGLIDRCAFYMTSGKIPIYNYHQTWDGYDNSAGSWEDGPGWGSEYFLFVEDNVVWFEGFDYAACDAYRGARGVFRYNYFHRAAPEQHGTDSGGILRGARAIEMYYNILDGRQDNYVINFRSGAGIVFGNITTNYAGTPFVRMDQYARMTPFSPFGQPDGTNAWHTYQPGSPFDSGTATGGGTRLLTDTGKSWTPNQWVGYQVTRTNGASAYNSCTIRTNGVDTLWTDDGSAGQSGDIVFANGDKYIIVGVLESFDQPGRGYGTRLSGDPPTPVGNDQIDDPIYSWNNTNTAGGDVIFSVGAMFIRAGEHYTNSAPVGYTSYTYPHPLAAQSGVRQITGTFSAEGNWSLSSQ